MCRLVSGQKVPNLFYLTATSSEIASDSSAAIHVVEDRWKTSAQTGRQLLSKTCMGAFQDTARHARAVGCRGVP